MWVYGYRCKGQQVRAMAPCLHPIAIPTGPPKYTHAYLHFSPLRLTPESANHHFQLHPVIQTHANKHAVLQGAAKEAWTNNVPGWKWRIRQLQRDVVEMRWIYREPLTMYLHMYGHLCVLIPTYIYIYIIINYMPLYQQRWTNSRCLAPKNGSRSSLNGSRSGHPGTLVNTKMAEKWLFVPVQT